MVNQALPSHLLGICRVCGKGIPKAYELPGVTKWTRALLSVPGATQELHVAVPHPDHVYCRDCFRSTERPKARSHCRPAIADLPPKEIALAMLKAMARWGRPMGSRLIARKAAINYSATVLAILRKLRDAGKVKFADGRWSLA